MGYSTLLYIGSFCFSLTGLPTSLSRCNDTLLEYALYKVSVTVDEKGNKVSLCYEIQGEANQYFNLISDTCVSVNALYSPGINALDGNIISKIGVLAEDNNGVEGNWKMLFFEITCCLRITRGNIIWRRLHFQLLQNMAISPWLHWFRSGQYGRFYFADRPRGRGPI